MRAKVNIFSAAGDTTLLEYDTETADMAEVNKLIDTFERDAPGVAIDAKTSLPLDIITPDVEEVLIVRNLVGG